MVRSFTPQSGPEELAPSPHRFTVSGNDAPAMPDICANCAATTDMMLPVQKVFLKRWRAVDQTAKRWTTHRGMLIPFCDDCIARHRSLAPDWTPSQRFIIGLSSELAIPTVLCTAAALFCLRESVRSIGHSGAGFMATLAGIFLLIALGCWRASVFNTKWRLIPEQSEVTLACDFSDLLEDPSRTVFAIRDDRFAEAFAVRNADRIVPEKTKARRGH